MNTTLTSRLGRALRLAGVAAVTAATVVTPATSPAAASDLPDGSSPAATQNDTSLTRAVTSGALILDGHGNGHGIGLSQWGALGYAIDEGWSAARILDHYYGGTVAGTIPPGDISVRLTALDDAQTAVVHSKGQATLVGDPAARTWGSLVARETAAGRYRVWATASVLCPAASVNLDDPAFGWTVVADGLASPVIAPITDTSASNDVGDLVGVCEPGGTVRSYRGRIRAANGSDGENRTINDVPMEQYLRSVVPSESPAEWAQRGGGRGVEALLAQAVAARSYAAAQARYSYAKTCDTQACQVYTGAARRAGPAGAVTTNERPATDIAIVATAGLVRRAGGPGGAVVSTMFSSSSGGYTAPSTSPGFPAVPDDGDDVDGNPYHNWTRTIPVDDIERAWPQIGVFTGLTVTKRNGLGADGGRVLTAVVSGEAGSVTVSGDDVRKVFGLPSNWWSPRSPCGGRDTPPVGGPLPVNGNALGFMAVTPVRVADTRSGIGASATPLKGGCTLVVPLSPPPGATAVAVTVTTTGGVADGFTTAWACGSAQPNVSAVQVRGGVDVPGTTVVPIGTGGLCIFSSVTTGVIVDVLGWLGPVGLSFAGRLDLQAPVRVFDTRRVDGSSPLPAGTVTRIPSIVGQSVDGVAVSANITATGARAGGYLTAFPCSEPRPEASVVNFAPGVDSSNHAFVRLDAKREWCVYNSAATHLVVDVDGRFTGGEAGLATMVTAPARLVDSRSAIGTGGAWNAGETRAIALGDTRGGDVWFEITAVNPAAAGYITVAPCDEPMQETSVLNAPARTNVANLVVVSTDEGGKVCVLASMPTHILVDVIARSVTSEAGTEPFG